MLWDNANWSWICIFFQSITNNHVHNGDSFKFYDGLLWTWNIDYEPHADNKKLYKEIIIIWLRGLLSIYIKNIYDWWTSWNIWNNLNIKIK